MSRKYRLENEKEQERQEIHESIMMAEGKDKPSGIEVEENHVYFYCPVLEREALELVRILRRLDIEMKYLADRIGLKENPPIHLHIYSPGGDIFAGLSICDVISKCRTDVYTYIEGSAASAATMISCCGKKRFITQNSFMLIHQPQIMWAGKHDEFIDEIENQKLIYSTVKKIYLDRTKMDADQLDEMLKHELWLSSEKCLELGLVDEIC
jgi:ATP-dependent Clp endopeptidase proteolytic subunit ClpP|tara:strand:- start:856 stop:1485 length:630 start_codon:yes stop_codon:yes gene_type:complete